MPELGKYAITVLSAYGATLVILFAVIGLSLWRGARVRAELRAVEERADD